MFNAFPSYLNVASRTFLHQISGTSAKKIASQEKNQTGHSCIFGSNDHYEEFRRKTRYFHFCQFEIFAIETAKNKIWK